MSDPTALTGLLGQHRHRHHTSTVSGTYYCACSCGTADEECTSILDPIQDCIGRHLQHVAGLIEDEHIAPRITEAKADAYDKAIKSCRIVHTINPYRPDESDW